MKTIFNKALWASAIGACTLSLGSCTDLSETIYDTFASEKYEFTENDRAPMFAPLYSSLRDVYWGWYSYADMMDQSSDSWCIPYRISIGWGDLYVSMHKHQFHSQIAHFNDTWNRNYAGINACNKLLADEVIAADITTSSQLRAYRALYYYILFDLFRNIPLDTQYEHEDGWLPEQATPQQMWDFLISELTDVKGKCGTKVEMGKLNDYAINMLLAKMYLNHNAWFNDYSDNSYYGKAIDEVNEVINSGKFSLAPNYSDNFREDISGSPEIIFGIPFEFKYAGGNYMANMWMHVAGRATWQFNGWATGGAAVLPQFLETYDEEDSRYEDCWISGQQYDYAGAPIYVDSEPLVYTRELHSIDNPGCYPFESERLVKYEILSGDYGTSYDDVPFFRLADAYFIKAECLLRLGGYNGESEQVAADLVTAVRQRAFKSDPGKATVTVAQLKGGSRYNYGHRENQGIMGEADNWIITEEGGDDIELGGLLDELAWEFVAEHHRRQDLIRFRINGTNQNVYNGKSWFCKDAKTDKTDRHCDIFPLPKSALDGNIKLKQNPGYLIKNYKIIIMRKYILFIYMVCHLLHVYAGNLENKINSSYPHLVRVSMIKTLGSHQTPVTIEVSSPVRGIISNYNGINSIVETPVIIGPNLVMLSFRISGPFESGVHYRSLHITNSLGYDKIVKISSIDTFQDVIPLDPNATTVITIMITD